MSNRYLSPLRYPGGKGRVAPYIASLIRRQEPRPTVYAEPFAGGAGAALRLLADEVVQTIQLNDLAPGVAAFWRATFAHNEELALRIESAVVDLEHWHEARAIFLSQDTRSDLDLGFATFFLNRCNRSGILGARPIGGMEQAGNWKIDARFNREALAARVRFLGGYHRRVQVHELDAREFLKVIEPLGSGAFLYVDPPYMVQGENLYLDSLSMSDHEDLANRLKESSVPWMLTYDVSEQVTQRLYSGLRTAKFSISHTAQSQHIGRELVVFSNDLAVEGIELVAGANAHWLPNEGSVQHRACNLP